jgi:hypothetical protein
MQVGYNHNVKHKGKVYHIQTEDSGIPSAHVTTLLYCGGTIVASKKTSYEDSKNEEDYASLLRELMQNQHRQMLIDLKNGVYDDPEQVELEEADDVIKEEERSILDAIKAIEGRRLKEIIAEGERKKEQTQEKETEVEEKKPIEKYLIEKETSLTDKKTSDKGLDEVILNYLSKELSKKGEGEPEE